jgi:hypothetical protein
METIAMRFRAPVAVVITVLLAGLLQVSSAMGVTNSPAATVEAEKMTIPAGASILNAPTASGGQAVWMTQGNTSLTRQVSLPAGVSSLSLIAKAIRTRSGWPSISMKIDGAIAMPVTVVTATNWYTYSVSVSLSSGTHTLTFTDASGKGERDLYVDVFNFYAPTPSPTPTVTPTPTPTPTVSSATIDSSYFGEHVLGPLETNIGGSGVATAWPSWSPATIRLWNTYGYNSAKGTYKGISWGSINTASGVYDWTVFDAVLAKHKAEGVTDLIYTFGYTPVWAGGGANLDQAPSSNQYLATFATAVAQRAIADGLPIRNWEVWNEPNSGVGAWTGTNAQMVAMAQTVYQAVKAVDPSYKVLTPSPQGNATNWMSSYLAAGGGAYADVMAFHGYTSSGPETIATLIDSYKNVFATYGQTGKPIWDTEAMDLTTSDPVMQARFLAVYYLLQQAKGVARFYWYAYDGDQGQEWFSDTGAGAAAIADVQVHSWMLGATPGTLSQSGTIYTLPLTKGSQTLAVWNSAGSSAYAAVGYTKYTDLKGVVHAVSGGMVNIGKDPILLS